MSVGQRADVCERLNIKSIKAKHNVCTLRINGVIYRRHRILRNPLSHFQVILADIPAAGAPRNATYRFPAYGFPTKVHN